jgi:hypothetical protein
MDVCSPAIGTNAQMTTPYTECSVCFATATAVKVIVQRKLQMDKNTMESVLCSYGGAIHYSAIIGYLFEYHVMKMLQQGDTFTCQELVYPNTKEKPPNSTIMIS